MAAGIDIFKRITRFFRAFWRCHELSGVVYVSSMSEVPSKLDGQVYVVGQPAPKWAILECPCRCGERIDVNLMQNRRPYWRLDISGSGASLYPSLWMPADKCGSHFWLRGNQIEWVD